MKKLLALVTILTLVLMMTAVAFAAGATYEITVNGKTYTTSVDPKSVVIACSVYQQDAHQSIIRKAVVACAEAYGVRSMTTVTDSDVAKELEFLSTCMSQNVNGYVWAPCGTAALDPLIEARDAGAYVAIVNGLPVSEKYPESWTLFDGNFYNANDAMCATLGVVVKPSLEKVFADKIAAKEPLKVGIIAFDALSKEISDVRANATLDQLTAIGLEYQVVGRQDAVEQDKAIEVATDMLTANPDLDLFVSCCESASIGAIMTVANEGFAGKCYVAGIDVSVQIAKLMQEYPEIGLAFVGQSSFDGGWNAAEQIIQLCLGIAPEDTQERTGKENIQPDLILDSLAPQGIQSYIELLAEYGVTG